MATQSPTYHVSKLMIYESGVPETEIVCQQFDRSAQSDPDVVIVTDEKSIKIESIRQLQQQLGTQPLTSKGRLVIISPAERITKPAQQALLKLVEEPPANTQIVLVTNSRQGVLPTIQSRCVITVIPADGEAQSDHPSLVAQIAQLDTVRQKVEFIQSLPSKREELLEILLEEVRRPLPQTEDLEKMLNLKKKLIVTLEALQGNVNPTLCLEKWIL